MQANRRVGLDALLTPENCVLVMIDHQPFQLANVNSHEPTMVINNATGLANGDVPGDAGHSGDRRRLRKYVADVAKFLADYAGATGAALAWEMQLLRVGEGKGV